jgi:hypothetical protein
MYRLPAPLPSGYGNAHVQRHPGFSPAQLPTWAKIGVLVLVIYGTLAAEKWLRSHDPLTSY